MSDSKTQEPTVQKQQQQKGKGKGKGKKKGRKGMVLKTPKGTRDHNPTQMAIREKVFNTIISSFKKHGAVTIETPLFELKETLTNKYGEDSKLIYDLQDQGGELCSLRYDLTVPFARYLAMNRIQSMKRYHIGRVYRRDQPSANQGRWREFYQCDFDIAGKNEEPMLPDAEVLTVMTDILKNLELGAFKVKINNRKLLDGIFAICEVPDEMFRTICSSVDKLDKMSWADVKKEMLTKGLEEEKADRIWEFVQLNGEPKELLEIIKSKGICNGNESAQQGLAELEILFDYLEILSSLEYFCFDLSLARGLDYYTGVIYEAVMIDNSGLSVGSIAGGGRYDNLVKQFGGEDVNCVGFSVGVERIFAILEAQESDKIRMSATEVLVFSNSNSKTTDLMKERMRIVTMFRNADIPAEMVLKKNPRGDFQFKFGAERGIPYSVILSQEGFENQTVNVKVNQSGEETRDIPINEVIDFIKNLQSQANN